MWPSLLDVLVDPVFKRPLRLEPSLPPPDGAELQDGVLVGEAASYVIRAAIPRFVGATDDDQRQTSASFGYKSGRRSNYESPAMRKSARGWLVQRYGFADAAAMAAHFRAADRVLDAGCGSGFSSSLWMGDDWCCGEGAHWYGADISSAIDVARERLGGSRRLHYVQADVMQLPFAPQSFDLIFSEGVLHHTPSTEAAFHALVPLLRPGGEIMFYVYRRKAPLREFADDHIRQAVSGLPPEQAWDALKPLTALGRALAELRASIDVPEDVPYLGIRAGRHDVQRLIYWHVAKMFWNPELGFDENNHVNFDWYHPRYAHRHEEPEVRGWCADAGLRVTHFDVTNESGFTVRAVRP
jgi:arsenite methyltransferase